MAATQHGPDRIVSTDSTESVNNILSLDNEEKTAGADNLKEQPLATKDDRMVPLNTLHNPTAMGSSRDVTGNPGPLEAGGDRSAAYPPPNVNSPQAHTFYYGGGYENTAGGWDEYPQYLNAEGMELGSHGTYHENPSLMFHTSYGYSPQMPYGPYSPVTTPLPSVRGDGQLYSMQQFPFTGPYYQQPVPPSMPYITSPTPVSQGEVSIPTGIDQQGAYLADSHSPNSNGMLFEPGPGYHLQYGSFGRGSFTGGSGSPQFYDSRQGFDGFGSGGPWSDWSKYSDGQRSLTPLSSSLASPQPIGSFGSFPHNAAPFAARMASQQQRPLYGFGSTTSSYDRGYSQGGIYQGASFGGSISGLGINERSWIAFDKGRRRGRGSGSLYSYDGTLDVLCEQNRGPRALRPKSERNSSVDRKNGTSTPEANSELYNRPDFVTDYKDAKFFIIKSYSEDNVHKSIKYSIWASTPNGNKKLDSAYHEAKEKESTCPVFLLFSVNASAQFCGVAEMTGPVDFDKSVDYWQQDKWSGQFPVKWHIIKDVPNSQFRHIIIENNDNKPVTNSRDTQEAGLEQGLEILNIFKNYESDTSILDDFNFYEARQKAMQERKARQQSSPVTVPAAGGSEHQNPVMALSGDAIKQMSKSFAEAVRLEESSKEETGAKSGDLSKKSVTFQSG
ncbi:YTH domain-containing protein ECT4-like isoform X1 [Tasmannia lanceolata]|uniref:YTH domain-containing protein ECT4-like isoform X1 n=1 Tax=Tasmannia lanceolata TaxID=3420 RepID=UPI0040633CA1